LQYLGRMLTFLVREYQRREQHSQAYTVFSSQMPNVPCWRYWLSRWRRAA
jgi:hypothetical protein